jgi:hypothetical protein
LLLVAPVISLSSILSSLLIVSLSGPRHIVLAPNQLFSYSKFLVTGHIWPSPDISDPRRDISGPAVFNCLNEVSFRFDCLFTPPLGSFHHVVPFSNLSYKDLASAAIDQERLMKAAAEADKKKRVMPRSSGSGGYSCAPPKYHMVYTPASGQLCRPP